MAEKMYTKGEYLENNPTWHAEDSPWKAKQILKMIKRNNLHPKSVTEVGCGAGEILKNLQKNLHDSINFYGYEISPQAYKICKEKENKKMKFFLKDLTKEKSEKFDLILIMDIIEHLDDYFKFLKSLKKNSKYKIIHIPLEISAQSVVRGKPFDRARESVGHIHYFTKEIALEAVKDSGYEIVDFFYTPSCVELKNKSLISYLTRWPRKLLYAINKDFAVKILGGYSILILAK